MDNELMPPIPDKEVLQYYKWHRQRLFEVCKHWYDKFNGCYFYPLEDDAERRYISVTGVGMIMAILYRSDNWMILAMAMELCKNDRIREQLRAKVLNYKGVQ